MIGLLGLKTTQNEDVPFVPALNTDLLNIETQPTQCSSIQTIIKSKPTAQSFLEQYKIQSTITNLQNFQNSLMTSRADILRGLPQGENTVAVRQYYNRLNDTVMPYYDLINTCVKEGVEVEWNEWNSQKESTNESKERYESVLKPELKVSYYEGWFPLFRPMTEKTIFALFSAGVLFILFSLIFFLRLSGVEFNITFPFKFDIFSFPIDKYKPYIITSLITGIVIVIIGYSRGWFKKEEI